MKLSNLLELASLLEEMKESLSNWRLCDDDTFEMEVFENTVVVTLPKDSEHLLWDLKEKCSFKSENFNVEFKTSKF